MLRPGGMLLYSTCTFDARENEQIISLLREQIPQFHILEIEPYEGFTPGMPQVLAHPDDEIKKTVRIFPHKMKGEGHYLALLKKGEAQEASQDETCPARDASSRRSVKLPEALAEFFQEVSWEIDSRRLDIRRERVYYMPSSLPDVRGIRFLRTGLLLGELKKNRFEPSQALAMCLRKSEYARCIDLTAEDARVFRYLKGETLDVEDMVHIKEKGWRLVCVDGFPLGWGKLSGGVLKNKYLPGWRLNG